MASNSSAAIRWIVGFGSLALALLFLTLGSRALQESKALGQLHLATYIQANHGSTQQAWLESLSRQERHIHNITPAPGNRISFITAKFSLREINMALYAETRRPLLRVNVRGQGRVSIAPLSAAYSRNSPKSMPSIHARKAAPAWAWRSAKSLWHA